MRHRMPEPKIFKNQKLMNEFNEMMIRIKQHLFLDGDAGDFIVHPEPTVEELDDLTNKIMKVLQKDNEPMIKYNNDIYQRGFEDGYVTGYSE